MNTGCIALVARVLSVTPGHRYANRLSTDNSLTTLALVTHSSPGPVFYVQLPVVTAIATA